MQGMQKYFTAIFQTVDFDFLIAYLCIQLPAMKLAPVLSPF